mmetsp:Transcript_74844/g.167717  ORF Transcript_74844/g.167717 Transcript_74844/m.167717 type:complete len:488 (-) Transcript_74844:64-1527(-)
MAEPAKGKLELTKWLIPMLWAMFGFYFQSVCLHYATYVYIHKYADAPSNFARLADPFQENLFTKEYLNIHILDLLAGFFPGTFFLLSAFLAFKKVTVTKKGTLKLRTSRTLASDDGTQTERSDAMRKNVLQLWTKVMLCAGFLFILKGTLGAVTVVPDSSGWDVCKVRLKALGLNWMKKEHSFSDMMWIDFHWLIQYGQPLRYCGDMMYSGHTFVVTLFGLGLYELIRIIQPARGQFSTSRDAKNANLCKMFILIGLTIFSVGEQLLEIYSVEKSRFHYTSDIIVALVVTFLLYTNGVVAIVSKKWSKDGLGTLTKVWDDMKDITKAIKTGAEQDEWHKADEPPEEPREDSSEESKREFKAKKECWEDLQADLEKGINDNKEDWQHLISNGDIFIPPCCVPCCCYAGREHIYSDSQLKELLDTFVLSGTTKHDDKLRAPLQEYLKEHMVFSEGVSWHNFMSALKKEDSRHVPKDSRTTPLMAHQTHP